MEARGCEEGSRVVLWGQWPTWGEAGDRLSRLKKGMKWGQPAGTCRSHGLNEEGSWFSATAAAGLLGGVGHLGKHIIAITRMERMPCRGLEPLWGQRPARPQGSVARPEPGGGRGGAEGRPAGPSPMPSRGIALKVGVEMAWPLFQQKKMMGHSRVAGPGS